MNIDVENLRKATESRRSEVTPSWRCEYCRREFSSENTFMNHHCRERERLDELRSVLGQAAYSYYVEWMRHYGRKAPTIETFATSKFFSAFTRFAEHVEKIKLPQPTAFIKLMVDGDISPMLWRRDQCYAIYLEHFDRLNEPLDQVSKSAERLMEICEREEIAPGKVFSHLGSKRLIEMVKLRHLSPWLLFCSKTFSAFVKTMDPDDTRELMSVVNPSFWSKKLDGNKEMVRDIISISNGLGF